MKKQILIIAILFISIQINAQQSKIIGNWQLSKVTEKGVTKTNYTTVFIFADKGVLKAAKNASSDIIEVGTWKYNKKRKAIIMSSTLDKDFNGKATVLKVTENTLTYKKDGAILSFTKLDKLDTPPETKPAISIKPKLSFNRDAMLDADGSFNYEDEDKLPWKIDSIVNYLKNYKEIVYTATHFPNDYKPNSFLVSSKINYNVTDQTIDVREYSYAQNDYIDMNEDPITMNDLTDYEDDFHFFPKDNLTIYKVVGTENIKTPLGNFDCTVVEGFSEFDNKIKYWMINSKPGVYAKIILVKEAPGSFGYTNVYTLKKLNK